jgi:TolB-like protein/Tfp pilus assembly protein PilF
MFTDIVGYTSMMDQDEFVALELIRKCRTIQKTLIDKHHGTWLKEMGDGTLARFKSALEAVKCAIEIQIAVRSELDVKIRIGIHLGDITFENEDVFGTGVNIASRIQGVADPGGIYISDTIYKVISSVPEINCQYLGEFNLKNVKESLSLYAVQGFGLPLPIVNRKNGLITSKFSNKLPLIISISIVTLAFIIYILLKGVVFGPSSSPIKSLAVLPFENLSGDPNQEFFSDGITEALIIDLSKISALKVISRTSIMKYKKSGKSIPEIARELNVDAILVGSVFKEGDIVSISAQLIDAVDDQNIWVERYERNLSSILRLYSEVAQVIAGEIKINIQPEEQERLDNVSLVNPDAYEAYLKGKSQIYKISVSNFDSAYYYFSLSLELDSSNVLTYAGLGLYWVAMGQWGGIDPEEGTANAWKALNKAAQLDSSLAEVHLLKALILTSHDWDWDMAVKEFTTTIKLNPNLPEPRLFYADLLLSLQQQDEAMYQIRRAIEVDPLNAFSHSIFGWALYSSRKFDEAVQAFNKSLELDSINSLSLRCMWSIHSINGNYDKAIKFAIRFYLSQGNVEISRDLKTGYETNNYRNTLKLAADHSIEQIEDRYVPPMHIARLYIFCGEYEKAIELLEKAYDERFPSMFSLNVDPHWDALKGMPGFEKLIEKMDYPPISSIFLSK